MPPPPCGTFSSVQRREPPEPDRVLRRCLVSTHGAAPTGGGMPAPGLALGDESVSLEGAEKRRQHGSLRTSPGEARRRRVLRRQAREDAPRKASQQSRWTARAACPALQRLRAAAQHYARVSRSSPGARHSARAACALRCAPRNFFVHAAGAARCGARGAAHLVTQRRRWQLATVAAPQVSPRKRAKAAPEGAACVATSLRHGTLLARLDVESVVWWTA